MNRDKLIILGCDDAKRMASLMNGLTREAFYCNIITAARPVDFINLIKAMKPDIVICFFYNNATVLNDVNKSIEKQHLPVICIVPKQTPEKIQLPHKVIIFTYAAEFVNRGNGLAMLIKSILHLKDSTEEKSNVSSIADAAIIESQSVSNRDMSKVVLELDQKVDVLLKVKQRIASLYTHVDEPIRLELNNIVSAIKNSINDNKLWEDFKLYFVKTNPNFLFLLAGKYPALTQIDLKYCCYLKMNMTNDDIRSLLGINQESVRTHKYRLKKKLSLGKDDSLRGYLQSVN
jgi:DNA-binding CsgD family transcriptional regulator